MVSVAFLKNDEIVQTVDFYTKLHFHNAVCLNFNVKKKKKKIHSFFIYCHPIVFHQGYLPPTKNGVEPKRPSRPINITSLVRLSTTVPNTIVVSWTSEIGRVG